MSASVSVGFAPSPTSTVTPPGGGAAPADGGDGGGDLFATLLALVGQELAPAVSDATEALPAVAGDLAGLIEAIAPGDGAAPLVEDGKSVLQSLGDALTSIADSLEGGKPVDPAQEKRLREALDAAGLYLGGLPAALAAAPAPTDSTPDPAIDKLAGLVEKLGQALAPANPDLAGKLGGVAAELRSGGITTDMLKDLGLSGDVDGDIEKLLAAFSAPRSATKAPEQQPIAAPVLPSAEALTDSDAPASPAATTTPDEAASGQPVRPHSAKPQPELTMVRTDAPQKPDMTAPDAKVDANDPVADVAAGAAAQQAAAGGVAGATRVAHAAYQSPVQQINFPQVAFEVVRQFEGGNSRFQIRLDPPELGRIDVKLDMDKHGTVNARMIVERPETLDLMQRDQRALQQALNQAGLDTSRANLEFSLRQNPFGPGQNGGQGQGQASAFTQAAGSGEDEMAPLAEAVTTLYRGTASAGGVNLFV